MMLGSLNFQEKAVVVSGCCSGIGHCVAELLIELGARVHGVDIRQPDLPMVSFFPTDLSDRDSIENTAGLLSDPVDALFNCAGLSPTKDPEAILKVNFLGMRQLTESLVPRMNPGGAIVSVGSSGGAGWRQRIALLKEFLAADSFEGALAWWRAHADTLNAYSFSKEAIAVWTMQQAVSLIKREIRVNCTSPGAVQTPMLEEIESVFSAAAVDVVADPIGRRSSAREQAIPLLFLNSDLCSYVNGVDLPVDGGFIARQVLG